MWQFRYTDEIYHCGVKGMKWGVRRTKEQLKYNPNSIKAAIDKNKSLRTSTGIKVKKSLVML